MQEKDSSEDIRCVHPWTQRTNGLARRWEWQCIRGCSKTVRHIHSTLECGVRVTRSLRFSASAEQYRLSKAEIDRFKTQMLQRSAYCCSLGRRVWQCSPWFTWISLPKRLLAKAHEQSQLSCRWIVDSAQCHFGRQEFQTGELLHWDPFLEEAS